MKKKIIYSIFNRLKSCFYLRVIYIKTRSLLIKCKTNKIEKIERFETKKYMRFYKKLPDFNNPQTFSEKILWYKLHYFNKDYNKWADKIEVKNMIYKSLGYNLFPATLKTFNYTDNIIFSNLPDKFVVKPNHISGYVFLAKKQNGTYLFKDLKNNKLAPYTEKQIKLLLKSVLKLPLYKINNEWVYKDIKPRIMIEEYIGGEDMVEYKLQMSSGKLAFINMLWGRETEVHDNYYDEKLNYMDIRWDNPSDKTKNLPREISNIIRIAETLSVNFPLSRIDFYYKGGRLMIGEVTFFYSSGYMNFIYPKNLDELLGEKIDISAYLKANA